MKSIYYQFMNFIQTMDSIWYVTLWFGLAALSLATILKFFKIYNGTQKKFEKLSLLVLTFVFFSCLVLLTAIRN